MKTLELVRTQPLSVNDCGVVPDPADRQCRCLTRRRPKWSQLLDVSRRLNYAHETAPTCDDDDSDDVCDDGLVRRQNRTYQSPRSLPTSLNRLRYLVSIPYRSELSTFQLLKQQKQQHVRHCCQSVSLNCITSKYKHDTSLNSHHRPSHSINGQRKHTENRQASCGRPTKRV